MSQLRRRRLPRARLRVQYPYEQAFRQIDRAGVLHCGRHGSCRGRSLGRGVLPWRYCHLTGRARAERNACAAQARPRASSTSSRLSSCRRLCRLRLSPSMTSRGACAASTPGSHWRIGVAFVFALVADLRTNELTARTLLLTAILSVAATLLSLRTAQLEREQQRMRRTRDGLQERALALEARNRDLADRQDYEVELATLAERARIAREIHDNVGPPAHARLAAGRSPARGSRRRAWRRRRFRRR